MQILLTDSFKKQYKKVPREIQKSFLEKLEIFTENPRHPSLRIHKLKGVLRFFSSLSINKNYRAKFVIKNNTAEFIEIGTHDQIYK